MKTPVHICSNRYLISHIFHLAIFQEMVNKSSEFQLSFNMHFLVIFFYYFTMHSGFKKIESGFAEKNPTSH